VVANCYLRIETPNSHFAAMSFGNFGEAFPTAIGLGSRLPPIPERPLLAHGRGETRFIAGAGTSQPACRGSAGGGCDPGTIPGARSRGPWRQRGPRRHRRETLPQITSNP
jgi:hypothetical protein